MVNLYNKNTGDKIGKLSEQQLQFLIDQLVEESSIDQDYAITPLVLGYFETHGADPELLSMLREALGSRNEVIIEWRES